MLLLLQEVIRVKNNIKLIREDKGLTQKECAERLGITLRAWQTYEQGVSEPKQELLFKIADMFGVTLDYLLGREQKPAPYYHEGLEDGLKEIYQKLPRDVRANILQAMLDAVLSYQRQTQTEPDGGTLRKIAQTVLRDFYRDPVSAGTGEPLGNDPPKQIELLATPEALAADCVIRVHGSSMEDTFSDGDLVLVKYQETLEPGEIGVFILNGEGYIKEFGGDRLISHNPEYKDIPLHEYDTIRCTGKVIGTAEMSE